MNIKFTVMAHGFDKAALVEKALKELGIPYDAQVTTAPCNPKAKSVKRPRMGKADVMVVLHNADKHPMWDKVAIAKASGCSTTTVGRILSGTHVLQTSGVAPLSVKKSLQ